MKILIGTNNQHKYKQYKQFFGAYVKEFEILNPKDLGINEEPEENSEDLLDNAIEKCKQFGQKSGLITVADDTGLFVDALLGEPGVHARRWAGGSDYDRCIKLLERLKGFPGDQYPARYIGIVAAFNPKTSEFWKYKGIIEGFICQKFGPEGGFGYDRIFMVSSNKKYYSELSGNELIQISHRGRGIKELLASDFLNI